MKRSSCQEIAGGSPKILKKYCKFKKTAWPGGEGRLPPAVKPATRSARNQKGILWRASPRAYFGVILRYASYTHLTLPTIHSM